MTQNPTLTLPLIRGGNNCVAFYQHPMTLTDLRYLVTLAELRHFAKAAAACFVSQPTLSIAIKKLEDELDITLFERHRHELLVTPAGERIIQQAKVVLHESEHLKQLAQAEHDEFAARAFHKHVEKS